MPADTPKTIGPYRVLEALGKLGGTALYSAVGAGGAGMVTVKVLPPKRAADPESLARFDREAEAVARLSHPNVLPLLGHGQEGERLYLAMEYFGGTTLEEVLKARRLSLQEAIAVFKAICRGLQHAHQKGVLHRDLNPRNVVVSSDLATVKLADFGLSRPDSAGNVTGTMATSEISLGQLYYLAPEAIESRDGTDVRSDLYSAGAVFHEMLTGRSPGARFGLPSQLNPDVPSEVDVLVLRCLARSPDERPTSATQLLAELEKLEEALRLRLLSEIRGVARSTSRLLGGGEAGPNRRPLVWVAVGAVLLLLLAAGWFLTRSKGEDSAPPPAVPAAPASTP